VSFFNVKRFMQGACFAGLFSSCMSMASTSAQVFVSFSMPETLLVQTLTEATRLHMPVILNGLHHNSMLKTMNKIGMLSTRIPTLSLQIDPTAFERFDIHQVPALVVSRTGCFDVLYGNLVLSEGLNRIKRAGACGFNSEDLQEYTDA
jgi:conjugal transfer pilus assembly protein TrbC